MAFLTVNPDNSIEDITEADESGAGVEINLDSVVDDLAGVKTNQLGHSVFDYINGAIVLNKTRESEAESRRLQAEEDDFNFPDAMKTIAKAFLYFENELRTLKNSPLNTDGTVKLATQRQVIKALRTL